MNNKENEKIYVMYKKPIEKPQDNKQAKYNFICEVVNDALNGVFDTFGFDPDLETFVKLCINNYKNYEYLQDRYIEDYLFLCVSCYLGY